MKFIKGIVICCFLIFFALHYTQAEAQTGDDAGKKAVMVIVDRISFQDIKSLPGFRQVMDYGTIALMNNRPSGSYSACKGYVNIGSGARAEGTASAVEALKVDREVEELFYSRTGQTVIPGMVVNPGINRLISQNKRGEYGAIAGNIGHFLRAEGYRTALLGNADCGDSRIRWAISIAMDRNGIVDEGVVGEDILLDDQGFPTAKRTGFNKLIDVFEKTQQSADLIVVETGDLTRIEESKDMLSEQMYKSHRRDALLRIDKFMTYLKEKADLGHWLLMIITPYPSDDSIKEGARLTPLIVYGDKYKKGLLTSGTTRREGIVGGIDIAPTVIEYFGIAADGFTGRTLKTVYAKDGLERIERIGTAVVNTSNFRHPILYNYALFIIFVVLMGLFTILYPGLLNGWLVVAAELTLIAIMLFPAVLLLLPIIGFQTLIGTVVAAVLAAATAAVAIYICVKDVNRLLLFISGITVLLIVLDTVTGGGMIKSSILGYDPIIGARYYGIGNEYMGVAVGSAIIACCSLLEWDKAGLKFIVSLMGMMVIAIGYPGLGANIGGAITCLLAFSFFVLRVLEVKMGLKQAATVGMVTIAVLLAFLLLDTVFLEDHSHLAAAAQGTVQGGPLHMLTIVHRKLSMNFKLLRYTFWTKVLVTVIAVTGVLFYRPVGIFKEVFAKYPHYAKGWSALVVAAAAGMAANDSGVVTSATVSIFFISSMLYILIHERKIQRGPV